MEHRFEWKHLISPADRLMLLPRLDAVMQRDSHAVNGVSEIRSLYFDTPTDKALREKLDGVNMRDKYRIRLYKYSGDIFLERKSKINGLCAKIACRLTPEEAQRIVDGDWDWMPASGRGLCCELYAKMRGEGLRPKTVVDYTREPFTFPASTVRVTIDSNIRTGYQCTDFLNPDMVTLPAGDPAMILEVKWDNFLPDIIRDAVNIPDRRVTSFSKYAQCRIYG